MVLKKLAMEINHKILYFFILSRRTGRQTGSTDLNAANRKPRATMKTQLSKISFRCRTHNEKYLNIIVVNLIYKTESIKNRFNYPSLRKD
jgi:hypothetical protein